jgi:hypothetical protein
VDKELNWTLSFTATSPLFQFEEKEGLKRKDAVVIHKKNNGGIRIY